MHKLEFNDEETIFECIFCNEAYTTFESLSRHEILEHSMTDSDDTENLEQEAAGVDETVVQLENVDSSNLICKICNKRHVRDDFRNERFVTDDMFMGPICTCTCDTSSDTDSLEGHTQSKQLKLDDSNITSEPKATVEQHEELNMNPDTLNWVLLGPPILYDWNEPDMSTLSFSSNDDYIADESSMSAGVGLNQSYSSEEENMYSSFSYYSEAPGTSSKPDGSRYPGKRNTLSKKILKRSASDKTSVSPKSKPSGQSNEYEQSSKMVVPLTPICEGMKESTTSKNDSNFQLSSGEAHHRRLRPKLLVPSVSKLELIFNTDQPLTLSSDSNLQFFSNKANEGNLCPWFTVTSTSGERRHDTHQPVSSSDVQDDSRPFQEGNVHRLRALLELPPAPNLEMSKTDQPSTSSCDHAHQLPLDLLEFPPTSNLRILGTDGSSTSSFESVQQLSSDLSESPPISNREIRWTDQPSNSRCESVHQRSSDLFESPHASNLEILRTDQPSTSRCESVHQPSSDLLEPPPVSNLEILRSDGSSTSSCEEGLEPVFEGSSKRQSRPTILSVSKFDLGRTYETDPSSTSSGDHDYCIPSSKKKSQLSRSEGKSGKVMDFSTRSLNKPIRDVRSSRAIDHRELQEGKSVKKFKCEICGKAYKTKHIFKEHQENHATQSKPTCDECGKSFSTKARLRYHLRHVCGPDILMCRFCGQIFQDKHYLKLHEENHLSYIEEKRFKDL